MLTGSKAAERVNQQLARHLNQGMTNLSAIHRSCHGIKGLECVCPIKEEGYLATNFARPSEVTKGERITEVQIKPQASATFIEALLALGRHRLFLSQANIAALARGNQQLEAALPGAPIGKDCRGLGAAGFSHIALEQWLE